jgi:hypothetical protein
MKMANIWDVALYNVLDTDRRFRGAYYRHIRAIFSPPPPPNLCHLSDQLQYLIFNSPVPVNNYVTFVDVFRIFLSPGGLTDFWSIDQY